MKSTPLRKVRKQQRKKKAAQARVQSYRRAEAKADLFPDYTIKRGDATDQLVDAVRNALKQIRRNPHTHLGTWTDRFSEAKKRGFYTVVQEIKRRTQSPSNQCGTSAAEKFRICLPEAITALVPSALIDSYFPQSWFYIDYDWPHPSMFRVRFRTLESAKTPGGTAYYSIREPKITVDGRSYTLAFYRHAMQRIAERAYEDRTFAALAGTFMYFDDRQFFTSCSLPSGEPAVTFYKPGRMLDWHDGQRDGTRWRTLKNVHQRIGYGPLVFHGDRAIAVTFLAVGMRNTPEDELLRTTRLPPSERREIRDKAIECSQLWYVPEEDLATLRWFEHHGRSLFMPVPQQIAHRNQTC